MSDSRIEGKNWKDEQGNLYSDDEIMWSGHAKGFVLKKDVKDNIDKPETWTRVMTRF